MAKDKLEKCFEKISVNIKNLSQKYKLWEESLEKYRKKFSFIKDNDIKESCANEKMFFDYTLSIFLWIKPIATFEEYSILNLCRISGFIHEALVTDLLKFKTIDKNPNKKFIENIYKKNISKLGFEKKIECLKNTISEDLIEHLKHIKKLRNTVHIANDHDGIGRYYDRYEEESILDNEIEYSYKSNPKKIANELDDFINKFKKYYEHI